MFTRVSFTQLPEKRVPQVWAQSIDGGKTWTVAFDGVYVPRSKTPELMPREQETALALSAAPKHLRNGATVYVLEHEGFIKVKEGVNGFTCLVHRDHPLNQKPTC